MFSQWRIASSYINIKAIVFGEAVRLCHPNERKFDFLKSLVNLKNNCIRSNFNQKMTENYKKNRIVCETQFTKLLQISNQKKKQKLKAAIVYKNPRTH